MILFEEEQYTYFFHPLCGKNRRLYYDCIRQLIEKSKELPLLYETDARDTLILYLRNCTYGMQEEEETVGDKEDGISSRKTEAENASAIIRYFRRCGWLAAREIGRSGENIATVQPNCHKLIHAIEQIFNRDTSAAVTNHIFNVYDILKAAYTEDHGRAQRPYWNMLIPMTDAVADLKSELTILKDSIRTIMQMVIQTTETNALGQFLLKDEVMNTFFRDYFFIKKDGLIPGYIQEIERMLARFSTTEAYGRMIGEYGELKQTPEAQAREVVDSQLAMVRSFISYDYVGEMDAIDQKINSYYKLYATRILMVLNNQTNLQTYLNDVLMMVREMDGETRQMFFESISGDFGLQSYHYIGKKSIERRRKRKANRKTGALEQVTLSQEERIRLTQELFQTHQDSCSIQRTTEYLAEKMGEKAIWIPDETMLQTREDVLMLVASLVYSNSQSFPYEVTMLEGKIQTELVTMNQIQIKKQIREDGIHE